jgi:hypothetical protein
VKSIFVTNDEMIIPNPNPNTPIKTIKKGNSPHIQTNRCLENRNRGKSDKIKNWIQT